MVVTFFLIFGHFYLGAHLFLFFERLDIASYRLSLQISERENVQFHWVFSTDLFAIRNGFLIRFWFCFLLFLCFWNVHFFTIGRRHLYIQTRRIVYETCGYISQILCKTSEFSENSSGGEKKQIQYFFLFCCFFKHWKIRWPLLETLKI